MLATVAACSGAGWRRDQVGPAGLLATPEIGVELSPAKLYADVAYPEL